MTPPKNPLVYERGYVYIPLYIDVFRFKYMFNVSIREYFSILRSTAVFKLIPLLCTHVYLYMLSTMHPRVRSLIATTLTGPKPSTNMYLRK
jgi:hypothetical protein